MSRRLPWPLVGACLLLSSPALVWGQQMLPAPYSPPGHPVYSSASAPIQPGTASLPGTIQPAASAMPSTPETPGITITPEALYASMAGHEHPARGEATAVCDQDLGMPTVGDFFGVRYRQNLVVPVSRAVSYTFTNPTDTATSVVLSGRTAQGPLQNATVTTANGVVALPAGRPVTLTLQPGEVIQVNGTVVTARLSPGTEYAPSRGLIKASDYESPRPRDRFYVGYQYFSELLPRETAVQTGNRPLTGQGALMSTSPEVTSYVLSGAGLLTAGSVQDFTSFTTVATGGRLHREFAGFEKTFNFAGMDGSVGARLPLYQIEGTPSFSDVGDLTVLVKFVILGDMTTDNLLTAGFNSTFPTSGPIKTVKGDLSTVLLQPWVGWVCNKGPLYFQGFHGLIIPTDIRDTSLVYNSITTGVRIYDTPRCAVDCLKLIAAQAELHITNPMNNRQQTSAIQFDDLCVASVALHVGLCDSLLTVAAGAPFGDFRPYNYQFMALWSYAY